MLLPKPASFHIDLGSLWLIEWDRRSNEFIRNHSIYQLAQLESSHTILLRPPCRDCLSTSRVGRNGPYDFRPIMGAQANAPCALHNWRCRRCRRCRRWCITNRGRWYRWEARSCIGCQSGSCRCPHWWWCQGRIHRARNSMDSRARCCCSRSNRNPRSCNTRPHRNSS